MGWFTRCCEGAEPCSFCSSGTTPEQIQLDISGVTDATCDNCDDIDGSYVLTQTPADPCVWRVNSGTLRQDCGSGEQDVVYTFTLTHQLLGGWQLDIDRNGNPTGCKYAISLSAPYDCSTARTLTRTFQGTGCTWPATVDITPL